MHRGLGCVVPGGLSLRSTSGVSLNWPKTKSLCILVFLDRGLPLSMFTLVGLFYLVNVASRESSGQKPTLVVVYVFTQWGVRCGRGLCHE